MSKFEEWWEDQQPGASIAEKAVVYAAWQAALRYAAELCRKQIGSDYGDYGSGYESGTSDCAQAIERAAGERR